MCLWLCEEAQCFELCTQRRTRALGSVAGMSLPANEVMEEWESPPGFQSSSDDQWSQAQVWRVRSSSFAPLIKSGMRSIYQQVLYPCNETSTKAWNMEAGSACRSARHVCPQSRVSEEGVTYPPHALPSAPLPYVGSWGTSLFIKKLSCQM